MINVAQLRELTERATPGPWAVSTADDPTDKAHEIGIVGGEDGWVLADMCATVTDADGVDQLANAEFIAAARTALPELLRELEAQGKDAAIKQAHITRLWDFLVENFGAKPDVTFADGPCEYAMKLLSAERDRVIQECVKIAASWKRSSIQNDAEDAADECARDIEREIRSLTKPSSAPTAWPEQLGKDLLLTHDDGFAPPDEVPAWKANAAIDLAVRDAYAAYSTRQAQFDRERRHHCGAILNVAGDCDACQRRALTKPSAPVSDGWILASERLPESWVLVVCNGIVQHYAARWTGEVWEWSDPEADCAPKEVVTHWRPLPSAPVSTQVKEAK